MAKAKAVWLTWCPTGDEAQGIQKPAAELQKSGFQVAGGGFPRDVDKHEWADLANAVLSAEPAPDLWVVAGKRADFADPRLRYGMSLALATVRDQRQGAPLQELLVGLDFVPRAEELPTLLRSCHLIDGTKGSWPASVTIAAHGGKKGLPPRDVWRLNAVAHQFIGQWIEVGPRQGTWEGAMVGFAGEGVGIDQHGVGKRHEVPERTVLNYAIEGIKAEIGGTEFVANALKNPISAEEGYFLKLHGRPTRLFIGPYPGEEPTDMEAWIIDLV